MSTGLGHVGRAIAAAFTAEPDAAFSVEELCSRVDGIRRTDIEKKHRVAVLRAAKARSDLAHMTSEQPGGMLIFYVPDNVKSYGMARLKTDYPGAADASLHKQLAPGGKDHHRVVPGGAWHRHTEMFKAERDGDTARLEELQREQDAAMSALAGAIREAFTAAKPDKVSSDQEGTQR